MLCPGSKFGVSVGGCVQMLICIWCAPVSLFARMQVSLLSRTEWTAIRGVMGRPRRLSARFLQEERKKLKRYRDDIRLVQQGKVCASVCVCVRGVRVATAPPKWVVMA